MTQYLRKEEDRSIERYGTVKIYGRVDSGGTKGTDKIFGTVWTDASWSKENHSFLKSNDWKEEGSKRNRRVER